MKLIPGKTMQKNLANSLRCFSVLEEETYLLYKSLADRADLPLVSSTLLSIAYDCQKHSAVLNGIGEIIAKSKVNMEDCRKRLGPSFEAVQNLTQEIPKGRLTKEDTFSLLEKLMMFESTVGEEYNSMVQVKTLEYMTKEIRKIYNVDLKDLKYIFEVIIRDEELHPKLLSMIRKMVRRKEEQAEEFLFTAKIIDPYVWPKPAPNQTHEGTL